MDIDDVNIERAGPLEFRALITGSVERVRFLASMRLSQGSLSVSNLQLSGEPHHSFKSEAERRADYDTMPTVDTEEQGRMPDPDALKAVSAFAGRHEPVTSNHLRAFLFDPLECAVRDHIDGKLAGPLGQDDEARAVAEAAARLLPDPEYRRRLREAAEGHLPRERSRRGRPTKHEMLRWIAERYVELDHNPDQPPIRATLAREASEREGRDVPDSTIRSRIKRATEEGLLTPNPRGKHRQSQLGPRFHAGLKEGQ